MVSSSRRSSRRTTHATIRSSSTPTSRPRCTPSLGPRAPCWTCAAPLARPICSSRSTQQPPGSPHRTKAAKGEVRESNRSWCRWVSAHSLCQSEVRQTRVTQHEEPGVPLATWHHGKGGYRAGWRLVMLNFCSPAWCLHGLLAYAARSVKPLSDLGIFPCGDASCYPCCPRDAL